VAVDTGGAVWEAASPGRILEMKAGWMQPSGKKPLPGSTNAAGRAETSNSIGALGA